MATNTPPNGAFRGFGAPQSLFAMERQMDRIAATLGLDPLEVRLKNIIRLGDSFPYGQVMNEGVFAEEVLQDAVKRSDYLRKHKEYKTQTGRVRKGIGLSLCLHGGGFTGSGEDNMGTKVAVEYGHTGIVEVLASSTDMGQGASTVLPMIAAEALELPFERVFHPLPDTSRVPNSGPTVASRTTMYVGRVVRDAALDLLEKLKKHVEKTKNAASVIYKDGIFYDGQKRVWDFDGAALNWIETKGRLLGESLYKPDAVSAWNDEKYEGSYEYIAKSIKTFVSPKHKKKALRDFFKMMVINTLVQNGDAHLKNFGVLYENIQDIWLAPAYDVVCTTLYIQKDIPALHLLGSKKWWSKAFLLRFGKASCELSTSETLTLYDECVEALRIISSEIKERIETESALHVKIFLSSLVEVFERGKYF